MLLIGILFGLAMDYEVFLVSRMREQFVTAARRARRSITGYGQSGRVVTAAAIIMTAVFAAFILDPDPIIKSIGLALAFGVLVDAFVVRMTLVPAVMTLLGRRLVAARAASGGGCRTSTSRASRCRRAAQRARARLTPKIPVPDRKARQTAGLPAV